MCWKLQVYQRLLYIHGWLEAIFQQMSKFVQAGEGLDGLKRKLSPGWSVLFLKESKGLDKAGFSRLVNGGEARIDRLPRKSLRWDQLTRYLGGAKMDV